MLRFTVCSAPLWLAPRGRWRVLIGAGLLALAVLPAQAREEAREVISVLDFGAKPGGKFDNVKAFAAAVAAAKPGGKMVHIPAGEWLTSYHFPTRQAGPVSKLDSYNGMVVFGDGRQTVIKSMSPNGADVFQLNGVADLVVRDLALTGVKGNPASTVQGINGVSITNGGKNIRIERVHVFDLPYVDKGNYVDGGKAFTIQPGLAPTETAHIRIIDVSAQNTAFGFGVDINGARALARPPRDIEVRGSTFNSWYRGMYVSLSSHRGAAVPGGGKAVLLVPGLDIKMHDNTVQDAQYGFAGGRISGVRLTGNRFLSTRTERPARLPWDVARVPIQVVGAVRSQIDGNTIEYAQADDYLRIGGASIDGGGAPDVVELSVKNNRFRGKSDAAGLKVISKGLVRSSVITGNDFEGVTGAAYDKALSAPASANQVGQ